VAGLVVTPSAGTSGTAGRASRPPTCQQPTVATEKKARSAPVTSRVEPVTVKVALARRSLELSLR
jgi:hypothetical protein